MLPDNLEKWLSDESVKEIGVTEQHDQIDEEVRVVSKTNIITITYLPVLVQASGTPVQANGVCTPSSNLNTGFGRSVPKPYPRKGP